ncbi:hypothetical protein SAMN02927921_01819 [Sinomicrobium oceani]|uniref:Uncharacterized protein n=1 Tax=Sinomicrobium oceani TaxID=1150368 RepID=A0A1K1PJF2_9FLAO|nr:hypothetical protein SAMN02927921_01819 [Sinomicrobium oceani]
MNPKKLKILILSSVFIWGCKQKSELKKSDFRVVKDYTDFALKMENDDTLHIKVNLSMCL